MAEDKRICKFLLVLSLVLLPCIIGAAGREVKSEKELLRIRRGTKGEKMAESIEKYTNLGIMGFGIVNQVMTDGANDGIQSVADEMKEQNSKNGERSEEAASMFGDAIIKGAKKAASMSPFKK